jgi:hypothetical protein
MTQHLYRADTSIQHPNVIMMMRLVYYSQTNVLTEACGYKHYLSSLAPLSHYIVYKRAYSALITSTGCQPLSPS